MLLAIAATIVTSCQKDFDTPDALDIPEGNILTISELRQIYADSGVYTFDDYYTVFGSVTTDAVSGNFYKEFYMQDDEAAIKFTTDDPGIPYRGDYVRINLKGAVINSESAMLVVTLSDDEPNQVLIQDTQRFIEPKEVCMFQVGTGLQGQLITMKNIQFSENQLGETYADGINLSDENRYIMSCEGEELIVRSSGYSSFADMLVSEGNGSITAVVSQYNGTIQLEIRDLGDIQFNNPRCEEQGLTNSCEIDVVYLKDFEDADLTSGGWSQQVLAGTNDWFAGEYNGNGYAEASNYNGGALGTADIWLISAPLQLDTVSNPSMSFITISNFDGPDLRTYISTDFGDVLDVEDATWTELSGINYSPGFYEETYSGLIDLGAYVSANTYVAFRYTGSTTDGGRRQVDDFSIVRN